MSVPVYLNLDLVNNLIMQSILRHNGTLMINKGLNDSKIKTTTQGAAVKQTTNNKWIMYIKQTIQTIILSVDFYPLKGYWLTVTLQGYNSTP